MNQTKRILVVGPAWIGDMIMAQSLFKLLRQRLPGAEIDVLAPKTTAQLLTRMPEVNQAVIMDIPHGKLDWRQRYKTARRLRRQGYDQAIVLQRSAKAALVPWLAGIPVRTGYRGEMRLGLINDIRVLDRQRHPLKAQHYALLGLAGPESILASLPYPGLTLDTDNQQDLVAQLNLDLQRPVVGFAPGAAYGSAKAWPARHYAELAARLDRAGWACWVFGSQADRDLARQIMQAAPLHGVNLAERTRLTDIADLAALTRCFVGNDTGVTHLASATAPAVVGLYGSTDPDYAPPLAATSQRLWLGLGCAPCRQRECPLGHHACMEDLSVDDVFTACTRPGARQIQALHKLAHYV